MNIHGIKKHIQELKKEIKKKDGDIRLERRLRILNRVLKSKKNKKRKIKSGSK